MILNTLVATIHGSLQIASRYAVLALSLFGCVAAATPAHAGMLISADFGPQITDAHDFSGVEPNAASANVAFSGANVWNTLRVADFNQAPTTNPIFSALKDSLGVVTGVNFKITGSINGFDFISFYGANPADTLRHDMFFFNSRSTTANIDWEISGLVANTEYRFYAYGTRGDQSRLFDMLVDTDGDGLLNNETSKALGSSGTDMQHFQDAYFASVFTDSSGIIHGRGISRTGLEANWSGFQLAQVGVSTVPEPSSLALVGLAFFALLATRRTARASIS
jgi:hypothetical protein